MSENIQIEAEAKPTLCWRCEGRGWEQCSCGSCDPEDCPTCNGTGMAEDDEDENNE